MSETQTGGTWVEVAPGKWRLRLPDAERSERREGLPAIHTWNPKQSDIDKIYLTHLERKAGKHFVLPGNKRDAARHIERTLTEKHGGVWTAET